MVIFCLFNLIIELKEKIKNIVIGILVIGKLIKVGDFYIEGVVVVFFKDVIKFNLV